MVGSKSATLKVFYRSVHTLSNLQRSSLCVCHARVLKHNNGSVRPSGVVAGYSRLQEERSRLTETTVAGMQSHVAGHQFISFRSNAVLASLSSSRFYSSSSSDSSVGVDVSNNDGVGADWISQVKIAWERTAVAADAYSRSAKEVSDTFVQLLDSHPHLKNTLVPVGLTMAATVLAWVVLPKFLRRFYKYATLDYLASPHGGTGERDEQVPYEKTVWGALEDPLRYLVTFMAFLQIGIMMAPTTVASQYETQASRAAVCLSLVWFLYRWKSNLISRALGSKRLGVFDQEKLLTIDRISSVGLIFLGVMALAETGGFPLQSVLTVSGVGGVATAIAAKDVLGNVLSGLSMQFSKPFSLGDTIRAGSVEGKVVEMGLTTTLLLNSEKFQVMVPNSMFSGQVIVKKSGGKWRAMKWKIPMKLDDLEKIPYISNDIRSMMKSNPDVFLGKDAPYCCLSRVGKSYAELTLGCNLKHMNDEELSAAEQQILLQSIRILKQHDATLGNVAKIGTPTAPSCPV